LSLTLVSPMGFASAAFAQDTQELSPNDILESIETGDAAQKTGLPYGLALPEGATVTFSMLSGLSSQIEFEGKRKDLVSHFRSEFERLEYDLEEQSRKGGDTSLVGADPEEEGSKLVIRISKAKTRNNWLLVILKLTQ